MNPALTHTAATSMERVDLLSSASLTNRFFFLSQVFIHDFRHGLRTSNEQPFNSCAERTLADGCPHIERSGEKVLLSLPVFRSAELRSIVNFMGIARTGISGVFEIWKPTGVYHDLKLTESYFGQLDRFQNVSSFVRFEMGGGLPGQAAVNGHAVIHDDLQNHPGFLRAAGASAGELQAAVALPIFGPDFVATVLLISSKSTPLARRIEIWVRSGAELELSQIAQTDVDADLRCQFNVGKRVPLDSGILGEVVREQAAVLSTDSNLLTPCRGSQELEGQQSCLAIPTYRGADLNSICLFWL